MLLEGSKAKRKHGNEGGMKKGKKGKSLEATPLCVQQNKHFFELAILSVANAELLLCHLFGSFSFRV